MEKINFTLTEGESILAEFNVDKNEGFCCFYKKYNESNIVITDRRVIAVKKLGLTFGCGLFGAVATTFKEALISGLSGINSYTSVNAGISCFRGKTFSIDIGLMDGDNISFSPNVKNEEQAQAILHKIAEVIEQVKKTN